jgi:hypothetical protein
LRLGGPVASASDMAQVPGVVRRDAIVADFCADSVLITQPFTDEQVSTPSFF